MDVVTAAVVDFVRSLPLSLLGVVGGLRVGLRVGLPGGVGAVQDLVGGTGCMGVGGGVVTLVRGGGRDSCTV